MGRRRLISIAAVGTAIAALTAVTVLRQVADDVVTIPPMAEPTSAAVVPYDPAFAFKQPIPDSPALDSRSEAIVRRLSENRRSGALFLASRSEVPTVYRVRRGDPFYRVTVGGGSARFRVPPDARQGDGSDAPLVLLDPDHPDHGRATELRLWRASIDHAEGSLTAEGAGLLHYNNDGARLNPDGSRSLAVPFRGQGTGSGLSILAGLIRPEEVRAGTIRHALRFAYSSPDFTSDFRPPAVKTDQPKDTTTRDPASAMDMGMRLQLDPAVDCEERTVPGAPEGGRETQLLRMICRALQDYGMIAVDGTVDEGLVLMMEHSATARWPEIVGEERFGSYSWIVRDEASGRDGLRRDDTSGIPWSRMRVLKAGAVPPI